MKKQCVLLMALLPFGASTLAQEGMDMSISGNTHIAVVISDPALDGFGRLIFPTQFGEIPESLTLRDVGRLLPLSEALMRGVIRDLRAAIVSPWTIMHAAT